MKVVAFLPIKLNSQRLPRKNLLPLGGKPLCRHIIDSLTAVERIDEIYVYCSSEEILGYIPEQVTFLLRDKHLDGDLIKGFEIYEAFIRQVDADVYILAHTTSPFIKARTIQNALNKVLDDGYDSAFSAQKLKTFAWYQGKPLNYNINDVPRTQDIEPVYIETSAFFMFRKEIFTQHRRRIGFHPYIQEVDDMEAVDIDEMKDYRFAKMLIGDTDG
jgi:CMP-N-acetylneuraminic acid synthetase